MEKLKRYRIVTVFRYLRASWWYSSEIHSQTNYRFRWRTAIDIFYCFVKYGHDFNDYCTFSLWNKTHGERNEYISFRRNTTLRYAFTTPQAYDLFLDKAAFNQHFRHYIRRPWLCTEGLDWEVILAFIHRQQQVVVKPRKSACGVGIFKIDATQKSAGNMLDELQKSIARGEVYVIEKIVQNSDELRHWAPASLNTLRVVTILDAQGQLHIVAALLRMGNGYSATDNYHQGGVVCPIAIEEGILLPYGYIQPNQRVCTHPFSGEVFDNYPVPRWEACLALVQKLVREVPEARYVGWDIAITPDGLELIEGNIPPGEDITQLATGRGIWQQVKALI